jgi:transporter family-2 protein
LSSELPIDGVQLPVQWLAFVFALISGGANPFQSGTNAQLRTSLGQPLWTTAWVYASGLIGVLLVQTFVREPMPLAADATHAPWWAWVGGAISIVATFGGLTLAQKLGSGVFTGLSLTASLLVSIVLDHFGLIGFKQHTASPLRLLGAALMVGGVWLVSRF